MSNELFTTEYRCPGETYPISRAVHLGRLADFYAACRDCPRRDDNAGLPARKVLRLGEVHAQPQRGASMFTADGIRDVAINDMSPQMARRIAVEFARRVQSSKYAPRAVRPAAPVAGIPKLEASGGRHAERACCLVFASDGRMSTAAIVAAIVEGIRWTGCETVDLGPASAPCMVAAIEHLAADGGVYLGNPGGAAHTLGMKFWARCDSLSGGITRMEFIPFCVDEESGMNSALLTALDRPVRTFGPLRRFNAADIYLNDLRPAYHALRPLRS